jgi:hypothetical protein
MGEPDFIHWQQGGNGHSFRPNKDEKREFPFVMERHDGNLVKESIQLNTTAEHVLQQMAKALQAVGVVLSPCIPPPPPPNPFQQVQTTDDPAFQWQNAHRSTVASSSTSSATSNHWNGRNLRYFLSQESNLDTIRQCKAARLDAQAVAMQVRKTFGFSAVDAVSLGWSSYSVAILLRRLLDLHHEFRRQLHAQSFYPIRLQYWPHDIGSEGTNIGEKRTGNHYLDVFSGVLRIQPSATPIQVLEALRLVTPQEIVRVKHYQELLVLRTKQVKTDLGITIKKGHTCSSRDYHIFLERLLWDDECKDTIQQAATFPESPPFSPTNPIHAVVESANVCRLAFVEPSGTIRLGSDMNHSQIQMSICSLAKLSQVRLAMNELEITRCQRLASEVQGQLGLSKVYRTSNRISHREFFDCLLRISQTLSQNNELMQQSTRFFTGNTLEIASAGQFCHIGDSGSIVIPHNVKI